jgi:light-regulated signal transduction histidine kinase (bacteriophytochrome)
LYNDVRRSNSELRRANDDLAQFAYTASHDLQEPLRMVASYSQLLERRCSSQLDRDAHEYLDFVIEGAQRMKMLVQDLLTYSQAGDVDNDEVAAVDSDAVLNEVLTNLQPSVRETGATIERLPLPPVRVKHVHLLQIFQNIISNALKYRNPDVPPHIEIGSQRTNEFVEFRISDNGIGIPEPDRKQVFGLFKRLHKDSASSGTGLGLAICQRTVERYGGRIWVESENGAGSTFFFTLPA